jgi:hypothetical protein
MDKDLQWLFFWGVLLFLSEKGSMQRRLSIIALLICLLSSCTPKAYSYKEANSVARHHAHRVNVKARQRRRTRRAIFNQYLKEQQAEFRLQHLRQKQLQQLDAAAHQ